MPYLPNDVRHFVHKRIGRGLKSFVGSGFNPIAGLGGFLEGDEPEFARPSRRRGGSPIAARVPSGRSLRAIRGRLTGGQTRCPSGKRQVGAFCVDIAAALPGGKPFVSRGLEPRSGRGQTQAYAPMTSTRTVRDCFPGDVLGKDGFCHNKSDISNKNREWPRGRRPLGTPGEMAALAKAASFGRRMETTVKRMQKIGVLKKPARRAAPPKTTHLLGPGPH